MAAWFIQVNDTEWARVDLIEHIEIEHTFECDIPYWYLKLTTSKHKEYEVDLKYLKHICTNFSISYEHIKKKLNDPT